MLRIKVGRLTKLMVVGLIFSLLGQILVIEAHGKDLGMDHIKIIEDFIENDSGLDTRGYLDFQEKDMVYLQSGIDREVIKNEIILLDDRIYELMRDYKKTKSGAILYRPSVAGSIHFLKSARQNRQDYLENPGNFTYTRDILYFPRKKIRGNYSKAIPKEKLDIIYEEVEYILDEKSGDLLDNLVVSVIPFQIKGIGAFTEVYGCGGQGITTVMSQNTSYQHRSGRAYREGVRSTFLHELGHVLHYKHSLGEENHKDRESDFWKTYNCIYDGELEFTFGKNGNGRSLRDWEKDCAESLAEDFRLCYSNDLGDRSFDGGKKNIDIEHRPEVDIFIREMLTKGRDLEEAGIYKSRLLGDRVEVINKWEINNISREGLDRFEIEYDGKDTEGYIEVRGLDESLVDRVGLGGGEGHKIIEIKENTSRIIKFVKINGDYKCVWRVDLI